MEQRSVPFRISGPVVAPTAPLVLTQWASNNYWPGRPFGPPIAIVVHTEGGSEAGTISTFDNNASQVSATYGVGLDGRADQFVSLDDSAWANGIRQRGNMWDANGLPNVNPNYLTVPIETEDHGLGATPVSDAEYSTVLSLSRKAMLHFGGPNGSIKYLLSHRDISPIDRPFCCGPRWWDSGRFATLAQALALRTLST